MKRTFAVGFACAMALMNPAAPTAAVAQSGYGSTQMNHDHRDRIDQTWTDRDQRDQSGYPSGQDRYRSDQGRYQSGQTDIEGRWITSRGYGVPSNIYSRGGGTLQAANLPRRMVIDQRRNVVRVEDFRGRLVQQIMVGDRPGDAERAGYAFGRWRGSKLVTVRSAGNDTRITQTFAVMNGGRTLVVYTRQDAMGTRRDVEFTNVYQKT